MRDTLEMVREAWAKAGEGWIDQNLYLDFEKAFKELEALVRADEREACAKVGWLVASSECDEEVLAAILARNKK
jgi:hypothetical protein